MSARYVTLRLPDPATGRTAPERPAADRDRLAQAAAGRGLPPPADLELARLLAATALPPVPDPPFYQALATIVRQIYAAAEAASTLRE